MSHMPFTEVAKESISQVAAEMLAELEARAAIEHRTVTEIVSDAIEHYLCSVPARVPRTVTLAAARAAAARILERRASHPLPDGVTIRTMLTHGRQ